jgi:hypothetical protein
MALDRSPALCANHSRDIGAARARPSIFNLRHYTPPPPFSGRSIRSWSFLFARLCAPWLANNSLNAVFATEWAEAGFIGPRFIANPQLHARLIAVRELDARMLDRLEDSCAGIFPPAQIAVLRLEPLDRRD